MFKAIPILLLLLGGGVALAEDVEARRARIRHVMNVMNIRFTSAITDHCVSAHPPSAAAVQHGYDGYVVTMTNAINETVDQIPVERLESFFTPERTQEWLEGLDSMIAPLLAKLRAQDPSVVCPQIVDELSHFTLEDARRSIQRGKDLIERSRSQRGKKAP